MENWRHFLTTGLCSRLLGAFFFLKELNWAWLILRLRDSFYLLPPLGPRVFRNGLTYLSRRSKNSWCEQRNISFISVSVNRVGIRNLVKYNYSWPMLSMSDLLINVVNLGLLGKGCCPGWQGHPPCKMCLYMNVREPELQNIMSSLPRHFVRHIPV